MILRLHYKLKTLADPVSNWRAQIIFSCLRNEYHWMTEQSLWNFWLMMVLHRKNYSCKNWQISAPLKIDVLELSDLHMEHLSKFYFVSGVISCGIKTRSFGVPGDRLHLTKSFLFQELSFFRSAFSESRYLRVIRCAYGTLDKSSFYNTCNYGWMQAE